MSQGALTVTGAVLDGESIGLRCVDGAITALGPDVTAQPGDFLLLRTESPELSLGGLYSDLVYAASGSIVDTTVAGERVLMRAGEVPGGEEIVARAVERSRRLGIST